jgi:hypothetical protein
MAGPVSGIVSIQEILGAGSTTVYTGTPGWKALISGITFNNPSAMTVTVSLYKASSTTTIDVYTFNLAAGDVVADNNQYNISGGDQLIVTTSAAGTNFMMSGNQFKS